jgi:UDP-4-amino-4-deoxy-L-arabinose-oxoglutarate aminotransferase
MITHSKPYITDTEKEYTARVLNSGMLTKGRIYAGFCERVNEYLGTSDSVFCSSGTSSLRAILDTVKAKDGIAKNEVILPTYVCRTVAEAVWSVGFRPVFCDIDEKWGIDAESAIKKMTDRTIAVIFVNIYGIIADFSRLREQGCLVIEDNCQAFCRDVGRDADFAFYSFHATKCLTTIEGGMAAVNNADYKDAFTKVAAKYEQANGYNDLNSAIGLAQIEQYDNMLRKRAEIAGFYLKNINSDLTAELRKAEKNIYFRFPLRYKGRQDFDVIREKFEKHGVAVRRGVDLLLHRFYGLSDTGFEVSKNVLNETVSIPIYPSLTLSEAEYIMNLVNEILGEL